MTTPHDHTEAIAALRAAASPKNVVVLEVSRLVLCPPHLNPNKMPPEKFALLVEAMRAARNGDELLQPVLVTPAPGGKFEVVDGTHRVEAAAAIGWTDLTCVVQDMTPAQVMAYRLGMNNNRGELDLSVAQANLVDLLMDDWTPEQLTVTGFTAEEIADLTRPQQPAPMAALDDEDDHEPAAKPFVLEIGFPDRESMKIAKRKLRKAAGRGGDLATGLLRVLGEETSK